MILKSISFHNFRNFDKKQYKINPYLTTIFGDNALGKTNLLEGIYFILKGEGFRESKEEQLIIFNEKNGYVDAKIEDKKNKDISNLRIDLTVNDFGLSKTYFLEKTKKGRHSYLKNLIPVVLFSPEQIEVIDRTMSYRREYFDKFLSGIDSEYKKCLTNYNQALRKRNKILESSFNSQNLDVELDYWNKLLIDNGSYLIMKRRKYISFLNSNSIIDSKKFEIKYKENKINQERFTESLQKELLIKRTLVGPHRDEYNIFMIDKSLVKKNIHMYGSRSEQRLSLFWLKINELKYLEDFFKKKPILLLDDIFSELDHNNQKLIFNLIGNYQTVITSTEKELIKLINLSDDTSYDTIDL
ncbi:MAG: replication and repair protein RecF protein [Candidatus Levybacteria bacterium GW2011_GWA2_37_36]|uniref:DNA replication and repair protein RecF n=1 Tax=Candidatus Roizmanbacteria bacterium GW2011_GWC2_34_23 TaxID=1618484 RepID=A0A0G0DDV8_9BACT|nr:MAG: replication and repair protein RecF protein [Candidatus Roizmanbacteria bacterium GW2011_GWC2_34_23]KKQ32891.1 MAG: replication and repair protein RecF protein [Candidatus Levybacteria bacterium GW2011_GWA2_37_36]